MNQSGSPAREPNRGRGHVQQRVLTAARKEQNRLAQKAFRQRRKETHRAATEAAQNARRVNPQRELRPRQARSLAQYTSQNSSILPLVSPSKTSSNDTIQVSDIFVSSDEISPDCLGLDPLILQSTTTTDSRSLDDIEAEYGFQIGVFAATNSTIVTQQQQQQQQQFLSNPCTTAIQFKPVALFTAMMYNAMSLGFDLNKMVTKDYISPFYREVAPYEDPSVLLSSMSSPSFPSDLQPTLPQIIYPHHPYLDLIPYPDLRARLITYTAARPRLFDLMDFKRDVYVNGGLVCWESGGGGSIGSAQPWDVRSWEAVPWFLNKWRMLLADGERNQIFTGSAWWRTARGGV